MYVFTVRRILQGVKGKFYTFRITRWYLYTFQMINVLKTLIEKIMIIEF